MMTEKERKVLESELKRLQEEELLLTGKNTVMKESVDKKTVKSKKPLTVEGLQKKQALLQMQVARIRRKKGKRVVTESVIDTKEKFDADLLECVNRMKSWDAVINYHLYEAVDSETVIPGEELQDVISSQQNDMQGDISSGAQGVEAQEKEENAEGSENEVSAEKATLDDLLAEIKVLNKTILQLVQFKDSALPDELQGVDDQQSKLQKRVDDFQEFQDNPEGGQQSIESEFSDDEEKTQNGQQPQVKPEDIQEAIDRRDLWKETANKLIAIDEKYHGKKKVNENAEEEAKEQAIDRLTEPDDDVKKQLQDLQDKIGNMMQSFEKKPINQDSFLPPTPVSVVSASGSAVGAVVGDVSPEAKIEDTLTKPEEVVVSGSENQLNKQRKQLLMQQQTIKKLQAKLGETK
jgi:hypothetical protein